MADKKVKVQINYKSGTIMVFECDTFTFEFKNNGDRSYEGTGMNPTPLYINLTDIESMWHLHDGEDKKE